MAGVKGMKGGGGARPGAGRKAKAPDVADIRDPLEFLLDVMQGTVDPSPKQMQAAIAAAQYTHCKAGGIEGKKGQRKAAAADVAGGRFAATAPPKLALVK